MDELDRFPDGRIPLTTMTLPVNSVLLVFDAVSLLLTDGLFGFTSNTDFFVLPGVVCSGSLVIDGAAGRSDGDTDRAGS